MSYFNNKFNKNKNQCNCPECRGVNIEHFEVDLNLEDPEEVIQHYFEMILEAKTEDEIYTLLHELFNESADYGYKSALIDDIEEKIGFLSSLQEE